MNVGVNLILAIIIITTMMIAAVVVVVVLVVLVVRNITLLSLHADISLSLYNTL